MPDLTGFVLHRVIEDIDFEGIGVPGLDGWFYRLEEGGRLRSVGVYTFEGTEIFRAWGYVGEKHCRASALRDEEGRWCATHLDCPEVRVHRRDQTVIGFSVRVGDAEPRYVRVNALVGA
ncbi:hypothetical protein Afil01_38160 [Actinorhabdospora filicis]|uniref:Uncharacterized protein n=1 Tax=Actinorhabdospora filicis TaxID=1785913 RepID=A0A9W6W9U6_9ACTN|nr:hypothetical protein [Actinorhabdospora filicis]GLZ79009.1 hypothetical protein Afil01_38160 [Actinorhabdospora filicis]